ncbi:MAG: response regulator RpfG family c-di-GMP phosphodiesterase [Planctomycetota bacterium]|jgi:response regulator RpfG family c-di-GMP phosphodiesterase
MATRTGLQAGRARQARSKILIVDDDPNVPRAIEIRYGGQFDITATHSGEEALGVLSSSPPFAVVLSDMMMPGLDGPGFLAQVGRLYPDSTRILMTASADIGSAVNAMNRGRLFRLIPKPWQGEDLSNALLDGVKEYERRVHERSLMEGTLQGSIEVLIELLSFSRPVELGAARAIAGKASLLGACFDELNMWEIKLAALLAPIGVMCIPAPPQKGNKQQELAQVFARAQIERAPRIAFELLKYIPRFEGVASIVRYQHKHFDGHGYPVDALSGNSIPLGSRILKVATDLHELQNKGMYLAAALRTMQGSPGVYDPQVLAAAKRCPDLDHHMEAGREREKRTVRLNALLPGHFLLNDIETEDGVLLVAAGRQISAPLLEGLRIHAESVMIREPIIIAANWEPTSGQLQGIVA